MSPRARAAALIVGEVVSVKPAVLKTRAAAVYSGRSVSGMLALRLEDAKARREGRPTQGPRWCTIGSSVFYRLADLDAWLEATAVDFGRVQFSNRGGTSEGDAA